MRIARFIVLVLFGALLSNYAVIAAEFLPVGFLSPGSNISHVAGLSADGNTVLGESYHLSDLDAFPNAVHGALFRWSAAAGMIPLVQPTSPAFSGTIEPLDQPWITAISRDGSTILFDRSTYEPTGLDGGLNFNYDRYLWSSSTGPENALQGPPLLIDASVTWNGLSNDGSKRVGTVGVDIYRFGGPNSMAVVWGDDGYWLPLGRLPAGPSTAPMSKGIAMSADGSVVVGNSTSVNAPGPSNSANYFEVVPIDQVTPPPPAFAGNSGYEAFVWTPADGMTGLGDLPGGDFESSATGVSADGQFVIGASSVDQGREGFLWTKDGGLAGLGFMNPDYHYSGPTAVSNNGIVVGTGLVSREIVGYYSFTNQPIYEDTLAAFIWDAEHGMRDLKSVLEQQYGLDLDGWQLTSAAGISDDGLTIAGNGINPFGQQECWVVQLQAIPEPSTIVLFLIAAALRAHRRRVTGHTMPNVRGSTNVEAVPADSSHG